MPGRFKVIRTVRPKLACTKCEAIFQAAAPSRPIPRGVAGPGLLAHVMVSKFCDHLPLHRQSRIYARDGVDIDRGTMAGWVQGARAARSLVASAGPLRAASSQGARRRHAGEGAGREGKTRTGRLWVYVRDDRPAAGDAPGGVVPLHARSQGRASSEATWATISGILQADAYGGFTRLYEPGRKIGPIIEAACRAHARRKFFDLARLQKSPIAVETVARIDALFGIEREVNGSSLRSANSCARNAAFGKTQPHFRKILSSKKLTCRFAQRASQSAYGASCFVQYIWEAAAGLDRLSAVKFHTR